MPFLSLCYLYIIGCNCWGGWENMVDCHIWTWVSSIRLVKKRVRFKTAILVGTCVQCNIWAGLLSAVLSWSYTKWVGIQLLLAFSACATESVGILTLRWGCPRWILYVPPCSERRKSDWCCGHDERGARFSLDPWFPIFKSLQIIDAKIGIVVDHMQPPHPPPPCTHKYN